MDFPRKEDKKRSTRSAASKKTLPDDKEDKINKIFFTASKKTPPDDEVKTNGMPSSEEMADSLDGITHLVASQRITPTPIHLYMPWINKCATRPRLPFTGRNNRLSDILSQVEKRKYECEVCGDSFSYKHVLQNHMRTHTGEKPFTCLECDKRFTRDHHLKTHMRLHTGERPFECNLCEKRFVQVANLRRHKRVHFVRSSESPPRAKKIPAIPLYAPFYKYFDGGVQEEPEDLSLGNRLR